MPISNGYLIALLFLPVPIKNLQAVIGIHSQILLPPQQVEKKTIVGQIRSRHTVLPLTPWAGLLCATIFKGLKLK